MAQKREKFNLQLSQITQIAKPKRIMNMSISYTPRLDFSAGPQTSRSNKFIDTSLTVRSSVKKIPTSFKKGFETHFERSADKTKDKYLMPRPIKGLKKSGDPSSSVKKIIQKRSFDGHSQIEKLLSLIKKKEPNSNQSFKKNTENKNLEISLRKTKEISNLKHAINENGVSGRASADYSESNLKKKPNYQCMIDYEHLYFQAVDKSKSLAEELQLLQTKCNQLERSLMDSRASVSKGSKTPESKFKETETQLTPNLELIQKRLFTIIENEKELNSQLGSLNIPLSDISSVLSTQEVLDQTLCLASSSSLFSPFKCESFDLLGQLEYYANSNISLQNMILQLLSTVGLKQTQQGYIVQLFDSQTETKETQLRKIDQKHKEAIEDLHLLSQKKEFRYNQQLKEMQQIIDMLFKESEKKVNSPSLMSVRSHKAFKTETGLQSSSFYSEAIESQSAGEDTLANPTLHASSEIQLQETQNLEPSTGQESKVSLYQIDNLLYKDK